MNRLAVAVLALALVAHAEERPATEPRAYVYVPFNVNSSRAEELERNVEALHRHLDLMASLRLKADYYFTYLAARQLMDADPALFDEIHAAGHGVHHHGANRPPRPMPVDRVKGEDWEEDVAAIEAYETHDIDARTGRLADVPGGLAWMKEELELDFFSTGRFFQASILHVAKRHGADMAVGLASNTGAGQNACWYLGVLMRPDTERVGLGYAQIVANALDGAPDPTDRARTLLEGASPREPLFFGILVHDHDFHTRNRAPLTDREMDRVWTSYEEALRWLSGRQDVRFVAMREVWGMAIDDRTRRLTREQALQAARVLATAEKLPLAIALDGEDWMSLADAFQVLRQALADPRGPYRSEDLLGPTRWPEDVLRTEGAFPAQDIVDAASAIRLVDRIPSEVVVREERVSAASFLVAMARALAGQDSDEVLVPPFSMLPEEVDHVAPTENGRDGQADALTKLQYWTYKPARWRFREDQ